MFPGKESKELHVVGKDIHNQRRKRNFVDDCFDVSIIDSFIVQNIHVPLNTRRVMNILSKTWNPSRDHRSQESTCAHVKRQMTSERRQMRTHICIFFLRTFYEDQFSHSRCWKSASRRNAPSPLGRNWLLSSPTNTDGLDSCQQSTRGGQKASVNNPDRIPLFEHSGASGSSSGSAPESFVLTTAES